MIFICILILIICLILNITAMAIPRFLLIYIGELSVNIGIFYGANRGVAQSVDCSIATSPIRDYCTAVKVLAVLATLFILFLIITIISISFFENKKQIMFYTKILYWFIILLNLTFIIIGGLYYNQFIKLPKMSSDNVELHESYYLSCTSSLLLIISLIIFCQIKIKDIKTINVVSF